MTEHDKIFSGVEATASSEQVVALSQGRRRLVKGALLATPAVMTLASGRLMANVANSSSCGARIGLTIKTNGNLQYVDGSTRVILDTSGRILKIVTGEYKFSYDSNGSVSSIKDNQNNDIDINDPNNQSIVSQANDLYNYYHNQKGISSCAISFT
ncbi:MAG: hypothetical protein RKR03_16465 [Candidatus Competibacter sp.]|nr:hypothetical protein [Candidatus Competibacter sp.]